MSKKLTVIKNPRKDEIPDIPIRFRKLYNLKLHLIEDKNKLKSGLPLIPLSHKEEIPPDEYKAPAPPPPKPSIKENVNTRPSIVIEENESEDNDEMYDDDVDFEDNLGREEVRNVVVNKQDDEQDDDFMNEVGEDNDSRQISRFEHEEEPEEEPEEEEYDPYAGLSPEEREAMEKEEYMWKFRILKKQYHNSATIPIPEYNEHSDLTIMKKSYERTIKEVMLDANVEQYKTYLLGGCLAIEYVCTSLIGVDLEGFTINQIQMMHKYDRLLIELGEKSYSSVGSNIPVEIRLLFMMLMQAAIFFAAKFVEQEHGGQMGDMFKMVMGMPPSEKENTPSTTDGFVKKKMRGPKTKASDIRSKMDNI